MTKTDKNQNCWICGEPAGTSEHKIKNSNVRSMFSEVTQNNPLYYNDNQGRKNLKIGSTKNRLLTWPDTLCSKCNNERTQPHDKAWYSLFNTIYNRKPLIQKGTIIRTNLIFPYKTRQNNNNNKTHENHKNSVQHQYKTNHNHNTTNQNHYETNQSHYTNK